MPSGWTAVSTIRMAAGRGRACGPPTGTEHRSIWKPARERRPKWSSSRSVPIRWHIDRREFDRVRLTRPYPKRMPGHWPGIRVLDRLRRNRLLTELEGRRQVPGFFPHTRKRLQIKTSGDELKYRSSVI